MPTFLQNYASPSKAPKGFTLAEVLITLSIIATIGVLIASATTSTMGSQKLLYQTRTVMNELSRAYGQYVQKQGMVLLGTTKASDVAQYLNRVRTITNGTGGSTPAGNYVQVLTGGASYSTSNVQNVGCTNGSASVVATPCYVLQDGGLLQFSSLAVFPTVANNNQISIVVFNYDPDGSDIQPATSIILTSSGRVTTTRWVAAPTTPTGNGFVKDSAATSAIPHAPFGDANGEPEYMWGFTYEQ